MQGSLNANIGSVSKITVPQAKDGQAPQKPFFVVSAADTNAGKNAPDSQKWVTVFVRAETVEKLEKLHAVMTVSHYFHAEGQASARINMYQGNVSANQTLSCTTAGITLMGKPLGLGAPASAEAAAPGAGDEDAVPAGAGTGAAPKGAADLEDEIGF